MESFGWCEKGHQCVRTRQVLSWFAWIPHGPLLEAAASVQLRDTEARALLVFPWNWAHISPGAWLPSLCMVQPPTATGIPASFRGRFTVIVLAVLLIGACGPVPLPLQMKRLLFRIIGQNWSSFVCSWFWATSNDTQGLLLALHSWCLVLRQLGLGQLHSRQDPYLFYYLSGPKKCTAFKIYRDKWQNKYKIIKLVGRSKSNSRRKIHGDKMPVSRNKSSQNLLTFPPQKTQNNNKSPS